MGPNSALCLFMGLLMKASYDAGAEVQSGALGWMSLLQKSNRIISICQRRAYLRLFVNQSSVIRADTVDCPRLDPRPAGVVHHSNNLCVLAPRLKERRFQARFGAGSNTIAQKHRICCRVLGA